MSTYIDTDTVEITAEEVDTVANTRIRVAVTERPPTMHERTLMLTPPWWHKMSLVVTLAPYVAVILTLLASLWHYTTVLVNAKDIDPSDPTGKTLMDVKRPISMAATDFTKEFWLGILTGVVIIGLFFVGGYIVKKTKTIIGGGAFIGLVVGVAVAITALCFSVSAEFSLIAFWFGVIIGLSGALIGAGQTMVIGPYFFMSWLKKK